MSALVRFATRQTRRSVPHAGATFCPRCGGTTRGQRDEADRLPPDAPTKFVPLPLALGIVALALRHDVNEGEAR